MIRVTAYSHRSPQTVGGSSGALGGSSGALGGLVCAGTYLLAVGTLHAAPSGRAWWWPPQEAGDVPKFVERSTARLWQVKKKSDRCSARCRLCQTARHQLQRQIGRCWFPLLCLQFANANVGGTSSSPGRPKENGMDGWMDGCLTVGPGPCLCRLTGGSRSS